jgi:hypothetical protein
MEEQRHPSDKTTKGEGDLSLIFAIMGAGFIYAFIKTWYELYKGDKKS